MSERTALAGAGAAHLALLAALSLGWASLPTPTPAAPDAIAVDLSEIALTPRAVSAEEPGGGAPPPPPAETAAPEPTPPPPPAEAREPEPRPPAPVAVVEPEPTPDPAPVVEPKPVPPRPKPAQAKPKPRADPDDLAAALDRELAATTPARRQPSRRDLTRSLDAALGSGPAPTPRPGPAQPRNAELSASAAASLAQAIRAQIVPCWNVPPGSEGMTVDLRLRLAPDGALAAAPEVRAQSGGENDGVRRAFAESAKRAVVRCAPLRLPADLYQHWRDIDPLHFDPKDIA